MKFTKKSDAKTPSISIVIPTYNECVWLPDTIDRIIKSLKQAKISEFEVIIVDDGSTDDTRLVVKGIIDKYKSDDIVYVYQKNSGRYLARKKGIYKSKYDYTWLIDSRVHASINSISYLVKELRDNPEDSVWNAHVNVKKQGNLIARFMDAITYIGWRRYFKKPRRCSYGIEEFDYYPKGTTSFFSPKKILIKAMRQFEKVPRDMKRSSDDTHLIRLISAENRINISPEFSCDYHARNKLKSFSKHSYHRGQVFIDGFLIKGTRFYYPILLFLAGSLTVLLTFMLYPRVMFFILPLLLLALFIEGLVAMVLGVNVRDAASLSLLTPLFAIYYGAGLWVATIKKIVKLIKINFKINKVLHVLKRNWKILVSIIIFTALSSYLYLGTATLNCTTSLATGPGDQTSGLIWLNSVVNKPLWGYTNISNAPFGEMLRSPVHITGFIQYIVFWLFGIISGPVCGYNLYTALALVFSATMVLLVVKKITNSTYLGMIAGIAATFTPYLQIKTGVHPSYSFFGLIVLIAFFLGKLFDKPKNSEAAILGLLVGLILYVDPYFSLLTGVTCLGVILASVSYMVARSVVRKRLITKASILRIIKCGLVAMITFSFIALPIAYVKIRYADRINAEVSSVRSDIKVEAQTYGARPSEYLNPAPENPFLRKFTLTKPKVLVRTPHGSNAAENSISVSLTLLLLIVFGSSLFLVDTFRVIKNKKRIFFKGHTYRYYYVFTIVGLLAFLVSMPPNAYGIKMPSYYITNYINVWRVFARLAVVVHFSMAILGVLVLKAISNVHRRLYYLLSLALLAGVMVEYITFTLPIHNRDWSYDQVKPFYSWIRDERTVDTIAEYPLNETGQTSVSVAYFTAQFVHKKRLINSANAASPQAVLRNGLRDITDPQTVAALSSMGTDLVIIHAEDAKEPPKDIMGLTLVQGDGLSGSPDSIYIGGKVWIYRVTSPKDKDNIVVFPGVGFNEVRFNSNYTQVEYGFNKESQLSFFDLTNGDIYRKDLEKKLSMKITATSDGLLNIKQSDKLLRSLNIQKDITYTVDLTVMTGKSIYLETQSSGTHVLIRDINLL